VSAVTPDARQFIDYEVSDRIATITLNRPEAANAQTPELLDQLDAAWQRAADDDEVRVIILQANGKHFSAGHDIKAVGTGNNGTRSGEGQASAGTTAKWTLAGIYAIEARRFLEYSLRWRNVPKPSIAAVQGVCISGGLLLCWPCDLIIAAANARFSDPVVNLGIGGVEYHGHTWELGPRKAKEILFTGRHLTAQEAERTGMVNRVVPLDELRPATRALAADIARMDPFALRQAKRAVNQTLDVQGFYAAIQSVFDIHQTGHGNALSVSGLPILMLLDQMKAKISEEERLPARSPVAGPVPHRPLDHFSAGRAGQRHGREVPAGGNLVVRQVPPAPAGKLLGGRAGAKDRDDDRADRVAGHVVIDGEDGRLADIGAVLEHVLHLGRRYVLRADQDQVPDPGVEVKQPALDAADVTHG
jgi:enoyl-CoA hydratase